MTAIRDRRSDPDADEVPVPWDARPVVGARRGLPWWGAVLVAFGLAVVGATVDMQLQNTLGWVFKICYFVGAVGGICAVQRRSLFGPMVQPPLILAITVPGVVLLVSPLPANSDTLAKALHVGTPLINGFPTMAITTGCTLAIGIFRLYRERDPNAPVKKAKSGKPKTPSDGKRPPARSGEGAGPRSGQAGRGAAARGRRPADDRGGAPRRPGAEHPSMPPLGRRQPPEDAPRRGEPGARGGKTPPPPPARRPRQPRGAVPEEGDRRRAGGVPGADRPRRTPPRSGDPRGGGQGGPRRAPDRRDDPPPRGRRPWEDDA